jgi:hypothetical protein
MQAMRAASAELGGLDGITTFCVTFKSSDHTLNIVLYTAQTIALLQAIRAASAELGGLDGITTFCEMAVPLVARLTEALGLPGNTPDAVDAARDKVC